MYSHSYYYDHSHCSHIRSHRRSNCESYILFLDKSYKLPVDLCMHDWYSVEHSDKWSNSHLDWYSDDCFVLYFDWYSVVEYSNKLPVDLCMYDWYSVEHSDRWSNSHLDWYSDDCFVLYFDWYSVVEYSNKLPVDLCMYDWYSVEHSDRWSNSHLDWYSDDCFEFGFDVCSDFPENFLFVLVSYHRSNTEN